MDNISQWLKTSVIPVLAICGIPGTIIALLLGVSWWVALLLLIPIGFITAIILIVFIMICLGLGFGS